MDESERCNGMVNNEQIPTIRSNNNNNNMAKQDRLAF